MFHDCIKTNVGNRHKVIPNSGPFHRSCPSSNAHFWCFVTAFCTFVTQSCQEKPDRHMQHLSKILEITSVNMLQKGVPWFTFYHDNTHTHTKYGPFFFHKLLNKLPSIDRRWCSYHFCPQGPPETTEKQVCFSSFNRACPCLLTHSLQHIQVGFVLIALIINYAYSCINGVNITDTGFSAAKENNLEIWGLLPNELVTTINIWKLLI